MSDKKKDTVFKTLSTIDVSKFTKELKTGYGSSKYLSWSDAWKKLMLSYPEASYEIIRDPETNLPYVVDDIGAMVFTRMTIDNVTHEMWLPVMDGNNKAMKKMPYEYRVKNGTRTVQAMTMFDVNTTIMRCLVKNMAMFGLGLNIYTGEDLPIPEEAFITPEEIAQQKKERDEMVANYVLGIDKAVEAEDADTLKELLAEVSTDQPLKAEVWSGLSATSQKFITSLKEKA